jgi:hypothetical protein
MELAASNNVPAASAMLGPKNRFKQSDSNNSLMKFVTVPFRNGRLTFRKDLVRLFTTGVHEQKSTLVARYGHDPELGKSVLKSGTVVYEVRPKRGRARLRIVAKLAPKREVLLPTSLEQLEIEFPELTEAVLPQSGLSRSPVIPLGYPAPEMMKLLLEMRQKGLAAPEPLGFLSASDSSTLYTRLVAGIGLYADFSNKPRNLRNKVITAVAREIASYHHAGYFRLNLDPAHIVFNSSKNHAHLTNFGYVERLAKRPSERFGLEEATRFVELSRKHDYFGTNGLFETEADEKRFLDEYLRHRQALERKA